MTYRYQYIRRAIYEESLTNKLNSYRSLSDMVRLFKRPLWIMLGVILLAIISIVIILIFNPTSPLVWIPSIIVILISVISQILREKYLYNNLARTNELTEKMQDYEQYVSDVCNILRTHGIDTYEKLIILKTECEGMLKIREDKFTKIDSKIVDILIGVPLGALIASIIYADNNTVPIAIGILMLMGLTILGVVKLIRLINYYSEGYFKDKYLLDTINEANYSI